MKLGAKTTTGWRATISVAMSNYIEAGSIIAIATSLGFWQAEFGISNFAVGLLAALSANAFGAAIGAAIGGPLCDRFGRKAIYTYDLLVYMAGVLLAAFARELHHAARGIRHHRYRRRRRYPRLVDLHRRAGAVGRAGQACRHRPAGLVGRPVHRLRAGRGAGPAGTAGFAADLPAPVRRRRRRVVDPAGPGRNRRSGRTRPRRRSRELAASDRRPRIARPVLPQGEHHRAAVPDRHLRFWNTVAGQAGIFMPRVYETAGLHSAVSRTCCRFSSGGAR